MEHEGCEIKSRNTIASHLTSFNFSFQVWPPPSSWEMGSLGRTVKRLLLVLVLYICAHEGKTNQGKCKMLLEAALHLRLGFTIDSSTLRANMWAFLLNQSLISTSNVRVTWSSRRDTLLRCTPSSFYKGHSKSVTSCVPRFLPDSSLLGPLGCPLSLQMSLLGRSENMVEVWYILGAHYKL